MCTILSVISFMCSVHHCIHEKSQRFSCLNLMHPLKQWQYNAVIICTFNSILHFCFTHIWYWFRCWFTKSIDSKFPFLLVGPRLILLWSFRPHWPSDKVRKFNWCNSECFIVVSDGDIFVKCPLSDIVQNIAGAASFGPFPLQWYFNWHRSSVCSSVWLTSATIWWHSFVANTGRPCISFSATSAAWCSLFSIIIRRTYKTR